MWKWKNRYHPAPINHLTRLTKGNTLTTTTGCCFNVKALNDKPWNMLSSEQVAQSRPTSGTGCKEQALMHRPGGQEAHNRGWRDWIIRVHLFRQLQLSPRIKTDRDFIYPGQKSSRASARFPKEEEISHYERVCGRGVVAISCYDLVCEEIKRLSCSTQCYRRLGMPCILKRLGLVSRHVTPHWDCGKWLEIDEKQLANEVPES